MFSYLAGSGFIWHLTAQVGGLIQLVTNGGQLLLMTRLHACGTSLYLRQDKIQEKKVLFVVSTNSRRWSNHCPCLGSARFPLLVHINQLFLVALFGTLFNISRQLDESRYCATVTLTQTACLYSTMRFQLPGALYASRPVLKKINQTTTVSTKCKGRLPLTTSAGDCCYQT